MIPQNPPGLNPAQEKAATAPDRPLLIVAGAGTGKTRTLTMRILHLLRQNVPPSGICALTFTNKAAREIEERVVHAYPEAGRVRRAGGADDRPFLGTFHSLGARILRREGKLLGRTPDFAIYDDQDAMQVMKRVLAKIGVETGRGRGAGASGRKEKGPAFFLDRVSRIKNGMISAEGAAETARMDAGVIQTALDEYEKTLKALNAFDFDDLIAKVVALFRVHPDVLARYHRRFSHVLVDEYQDINNVQYEMVRLLAAPHGRITVVGDDQQTIFSFRGSNFKLFLNFERDWPGAQVAVLDQNYRSSQNIISAASALISHNRKQKPKRLWTENAAGEKIELIETHDEEDEAELIADKVAEKIRGEETTRGDGEKTTRGGLAGGGASDGRGRGTIAVLYRTNAQSRAIEQALLRRGIPYDVYGGLKFYERKEIRDVVAGLRYAANPQDEIAKERLERACTKARFRAFQGELARATSGGRVCAVGGENGAPSARLAPLDVIKMFLRATEYFDYIDRTQTNPTDRRENIAELIAFAAGYAELAPLVEEITLLQSTDTAQNAAGQSVLKRTSGADRAAGATKQWQAQLMTMHLAKGLEFDTVFVAGACEGLLPHARSAHDDAQFEEERRLMYVAMTRARKRLIITFYDIPSRFIAEIPEEHMEFYEAADREAGERGAPRERGGCGGRGGRERARSFAEFTNDEERYITLD